MKYMEALILQPLLAHLRHDAQMQIAFCQLWRQRDALAALCDALPQAVFLLDEKRRVAWRNQRGTELLATGAGVSLNAGGALCGAHSRETARLRLALQQACQELRPVALSSS